MCSRRFFFLLVCRNSNFDAIPNLFRLFLRIFKRRRSSPEGEEERVLASQWSSEPCAEFRGSSREFRAPLRKARTGEDFGFIRFTAVRGGSIAINSNTNKIRSNNNSNSNENNNSSNNSNENNIKSNSNENNIKSNSNENNNVNCNSNENNNSSTVTPTKTTTTTTIAAIAATRLSQIKMPAYHVRSCLPETNRLVTGPWTRD